MATIRFYGNLKQYGTKFKINASTATEALNALYVQIGGLKKAIVEGHFRVRINKQDITEQTLVFGLHTQLPKDAVIHIVPRVAGAKNSGIFSFIAGAALLAVGFLAPASWGAWGVSLMASGAGMMIGGVAQMLTKLPGTDIGTSGSNNQNTSFSSLENTIAQGSPVPLCYGEIMIGSKVLSQGLETM